MLYASRLNRIWNKLPNLKVFQSSRPVILHLSQEADMGCTDYSFVKDDEVNDFIKSNRIECYKEIVNRIPPEYLERFEVKTVPTVIAILNGTKIGEIKRGNEEGCLNLFKKLTYDHVKSVYVERLEALISSEDSQKLREFIRDIPVQELEIDEELRKLKGRAEMLLYDDGNITLKEINTQLNIIDGIILKLERDKFNRLLSEYTGEIYENNAVFKELEVITSERDYNIPRNLDGLARAKFIKLKLLELHAVKSFNLNKYKDSFASCIIAYEILAELVKTNNIKFTRISQILETLFSCFDPTDLLIINARANLQNINGPRLLNSIPVSKRPLGGVARKRRGFGGRYIWQGLEYRPKRFKPRNLNSYLNEWKCIQDKNVPCVL